MGLLRLLLAGRAEPHLTQGHHWDSESRPRSPRHSLAQLSHRETFMRKIWAAERFELTKARKEEEKEKERWRQMYKMKYGGVRRAADFYRRSPRDVLKVLNDTCCHSVLGSGAFQLQCILTSHLACKEITTGPNPKHPPIIPLQFSEVSQQTCDSSFGAMGLSCIGPRNLPACRSLKEHREVTKQRQAVSSWGDTMETSHHLLMWTWIEVEHFMRFS